MTSRKWARLETEEKESDTAFETRMREYRAQCHQLCVYKTAQLAGTACKRDLLLDLVADYHAEKRALNMAEFSDFTIAAFQLVTRFPPSEPPTANATRTCCSTNTKTPPPRRRPS